MSTSSTADARANDRTDEIRRVVGEYLQKRAAGQAVSRKLTVAKYPRLAPELGVELEKLDRIEGALDEADDSRYERALSLLAIEERGSSADHEFSAEQDGPMLDGPIPTTIGRYRVRHLLGEGAFGLVYLAWDAELAREVAVKVSHAHQAPNPRSAESFLAEARILARLDHPCVVPIHDAGRTDDGRLYVVSKWIRGSDLQLRMRREKLSWREAAQIVTAIAEALAYAHARGLTHRDVKPANILLGPTGTPYLADFGLALSGRSLTEGRSFAGTPAYMSPEQARGESHRVDARSDIFSLGVVLYELLTDVKPFWSKSHKELLQQILWTEPVGPRRRDSSIPSELERICLKSLAKRAADRYDSAEELADDLRHYLDESERRPSPRASGQPDRLLLAPRPQESPAPRIVPRGLRPFDASDSKSFLPLLPGARDRDGVPESIRQWKVRIEQDTAEESFAVGVLYGPSGCGKSSLIRAGLLPRLSTNVHTVYVEATPDGAEARIRKKLVGRYPELPQNGSLADCLAALRCGKGPAEGSKLLFVIDQFEQWLHGRREEDRRELVQALRHCDGVRLQCLLLVRDDFWLALSRFMMELEVDLVQRHNSALVDLFDPAHARKVLAEFGRAFGQLPDDLSELTSSQETFLRRAIEGLADGEKIVPVRLALFAEMVKGKPWSPSALRNMGGAAGVGVTFLEETFSDRTANPRHRLHEQAARAVLGALLPEADSDMKGGIRSYPELLDLSGYGEKPRMFKELMRILDGETRLITPSDPEVVGEEDTVVQRGVRYYQLTHDYLVPALRQWLTRKQKSTPTGRCELRLASRAAMWNATGERRQLPSLWEWGSIRLLSRPRLWTEPQRKMMRAAARYHALTVGFLGTILLVFLFGGLELTGMTRDLLVQFRARIATVLMAIGYEEAVWPLLENSPDATLRTRVIHGFSPLLLEPENLLSQVDEQEDVSRRRGMLLAAGELLEEPAERFDTRVGLEPDRLPEDVVQWLVDLYQNDPDPGVHAAAEWTLGRCGQKDQIARCDRELVSTGPRGDRRWYVNRQGHTMVVIPGPMEFLMGSGEDRQPRSQSIHRSFSIAGSETTIGQFRKFLGDNPWAGRKGDMLVGSDANLPQAAVTWYEAAAYCNWLSQSEGLQPDQWCYLPNSRGEYAIGMKLADDYADRHGYRLPTEPEWEYACRAEATTVYSFGSDVSYLEHYGVFLESSEGQAQVVEARKPNDFGLFDMHGNLSEWCQDVYGSRGDDNRVLRGGTFLDSADRTTCGARSNGRPDQPRKQSGFRVARGYP